MRTIPPFTLAEKLEKLGALDGAASLVRDIVQRVLPQGPVRDALQGVWMGHPVHPMAVQVPLGAWLSAGVLDCLPGFGKASTVLVGVGLLSAGSATAAGLADYSELQKQQQRVALVHAITMDTAVALYGVSLVRRLTGKGGRLPAFAGLATALAGGWLGGHLSFHLAAGANHAEDIPHIVAPGWQALCSLDELVPNQPQRRMLDSVPVFVLRSASGDDVRVLSDRCSHLSGPLSEGTLETVGGSECIVCPWHASAFDLATGEVTRGPATAKQPAFSTRISNGTVEVCLTDAG